MQAVSKLSVFQTNEMGAVGWTKKLNVLMINNSHNHKMYFSNKLCEYNAMIKI